MKLTQKELFDKNKTGTLTYNKEKIEVVRGGYSISGASFTRIEFDNEMTYNNPDFASGWMFIVKENGKYYGKILNLEKSIIPTNNCYEKITPSKAKKILDSYEKNLKD